MFDWLKLKMKSVFRGKRDNFKRDEQGHALANRYGVDDQTNEPLDSPSPAIRRSTQES